MHLVPGLRFTPRRRVRVVRTPSCVASRKRTSGLSFQIANGAPSPLAVKACGAFSSAACEDDAKSAVHEMLPRVVCCLARRPRSLTLQLTVCGLSRSGRRDETMSPGVNVRASRRGALTEKWSGGSESRLFEAQVVPAELRQERNAPSDFFPARLEFTEGDIVSAQRPRATARGTRQPIARKRVPARVA